MVIIPINNEFRIELTDSTAWQLSQRKTIMGKESWTFVSNMKDVEKLLGRLAARKIKALPEVLDNARDVAEAWKAQSDAFVKLMLQHSPANKVMLELIELRNENRALRQKVSALEPKEPKKNRATRAI